MNNLLDVSETKKNKAMRGEGLELFSLELCGTGEGCDSNISTDNSSDDKNDSTSV